MKILDISWPISHQIVEYKDKKTIEFVSLKQFEKDAVRDSAIKLGLHTGTHIDAPSHFIADGETVEHVELNTLVGGCKVIDLQHLEEKISNQDLQDCEIAPSDIVLFKTNNSLLPTEGLFTPNFVYLSKDGAQFLASKKVRAVGIDYLGIERNQPGHETHTILFKAGVSIIEGLRLKEVTPGSYTLYCLPLALVGLEASPARAVLVK